MGLRVRFSKNALKGIEYIKNHPEDRASDLLDAYANPDVDMILCAIGGDDTYRKFHVTNLNIAQVKQKHGIIERENYNKPKSENSRHPGTTPEKENAITEALKFFKMI
jgi:hypothetical protein